MLANTPWPKARKDLKNTGYTPAKHTTGNVLKWTFSTVYYKVTGDPTIAPDGTIYVGDYDNNFYAVNPNGTQKHIYIGGTGWYGGAAIDTDGIIYIGNWNKYIYAFYPDLIVKWKYLVSHWGFEGSPTIGSDNTIYVGDYNGVFWALNPNGTLKWRYPSSSKLGQPIANVAAIADDHTIYFTAERQPDCLYALNPDGTLKWKYSGAGDIAVGGAAVGSDDTVYFLCSDYYFYAINPNGTFKWKCYVGNRSFGGGSSVAIGPSGNLYVGSTDGYFYAISPGGSVLWSYLVDKWLAVDAAIDGNEIIYFGTGDYFQALNPDGTLQWSYPINFNPYDEISDPAIDTDGTIYVGGYNNKALFAFGVATVSRLKLWTGTEWKTGVLKEWSGTSWVEKHGKQWDGIEWKQFV